MIYLAIWIVSAFIVIIASIGVLSMAWFVLAGLCVFIGERAQALVDWAARL